jgi:hypothetical protein
MNRTEGEAADELRVRELTLEKLRLNPRQYLAEHAAKFGNILNADDAATLFDEYNQNRAKYRLAVHAAATWIRDERFRLALAETAPEGKNRVVFMAGGNAAGKSTALAVTSIASRAQVVFDSTLSNPEHARKLVTQALDAGKMVTVLYVTRPLLEIFPAMLERGKEVGRVVTIEQLIHSHRGAAQTLRVLTVEFSQDLRVQFGFVDNASTGAREGGIELAVEEDYTEIRETLHELLRREFESGRIDDELYRRIRG